MRFRLTCTRPAPAHLKHTTVLVVVVVVIVVVAGMVVVGVDDTGGVELEAMNDGGGGRRLIKPASRTGNTCVRAAQRPETGSSAQDLSTLPTGV